MGDSVTHTYHLGEERATIQDPIPQLSLSLHCPFLIGWLGLYHDLIKVGVKRISPGSQSHDPPLRVHEIEKAFQHLVPG